MRKFILSLCFILFTTLTAFAQLISAEGKSYTVFSGVDYVFIFDDLKETTEITYTGLPADVKWYKYNETTPIYTGVKTFDQLEDATGYIFEKPTEIKLVFGLSIIKIMLRYWACLKLRTVIRNAKI
jgi:hypothetical protein